VDMCVAGFALGVLLALPLAASAQVPPERLKPPPEDVEEHTVIFELGAAGDWSRAEGFHPGGTFAIEVTPIENWLEVEVGFTAIRADASTEMPVDVLFKKPWRLSREVELMVGLGPEIVHTTGADHSTFWGLESVIDIMVWPRKNLGWYFEPGYEITFRDGTRHHGLGLAAGLLIGR
jgi:hypothetical protein